VALQLGALREALIKVAATPERGNPKRKAAEIERVEQGSDRFRRAGVTFRSLLCDTDVKPMGSSSPVTGRGRATAVDNGRYPAYP